MKKSVAIVCLNDEGKVLAVSRKDNHSDFGLPGGKVDEEDMDDVYLAAIREMKEETGLDIKNLKLLLSCPADGYLAYAFLADWEGEIKTDEPHVVKWAPFSKILEGQFKNYNLKVIESLNWLNVKICK